jgi:hypothetical protein
MKQIIHQTMSARISREEREYESKSLMCDNSLTTTLESQMDCVIGFRTMRSSKQDATMTTSDEKTIPAGRSKC